MKSLIKSGGFFFLLALLFSACQQDNSVSSSDDLGSVLTRSGKWKVAYYWDKDKDETSDFQGYTFEFKNNGILEALKGSEVKIGSWNVNSTSNKLVIKIGGTKPLDDLADDWIILEKNDQVVKLKDDNEQHLEELHFRVIN